MLFGMGPVGRIPRAPGTAHAPEDTVAPSTQEGGAVVPFGPSDPSRLIGGVATHRVALADPVAVAVDINDAVNVSTGRFGIITRDTAAQVLQTAGAGPCVVVVLHDATHGVAALAHFHPNQDATRSVAAMVDAARRAGLNPASTVAHVTGGRDDAPELPPRVLAALAPYGFAPGESDLLGLGVRDVQFHLRSGRIERYREVVSDRPPNAHEGSVAALERHPRAWRPRR